ncbi:MAG: sugar phosphate nucleotidyltransferase [Candidatus Paceibacterota bacterium]
MDKNIALVYMCAGISSRFGGRIKQFARIGKNGETLIEYSLNEALPLGFSKIIFIVGNKTEAPFKDFFNNEYKGVPVEYALQNYDESERDRPWGTIDAICAIKDVVNCPFIIMNGDDIYGKLDIETLHNHLSKENEEATIGYKLSDVIPEQGKTNRGIFKVENDMVQDIEETFNIEKNNLAQTRNTADDLCSMNIFALHPETLDLLCEKLVDFKKAHNGDRKAECLLPVELAILINEGKIKMKIYPAQDRWFGVTNPEDEEIVRNLIK